MKGGRNRQPLGYTIVEVMIVLAISGVMFLIATQFINGKQERAAFTQSVNEFESDVRDTVNQVENGQYSDVNFKCTQQTFPLTSYRYEAVATANQGTNSNCMFIGKFMHFNEAGSWGASDDQSHYETFSLAGNRIDPSTDKPVQGYGQAYPEPVQSIRPVGGGPTTLDLTTQGTVPQGLTVNWIKATDATTTISYTVYGIGFFQSLGNIQTGTNNLTSGSQPAVMFYVNSTNLSSDLTETGALNSLVAVPAPAPAPGSIAYKQANRVTICLTDGTQYAEVIVRGNDALTTFQKLSGLTPCS